MRTSAVLALLVLAALPAVADEIDDLAAKLGPEARFADYKPDWKVEKRTFTFQHVGGPKIKKWWVIMDGDKYVALHRSGDFNLLAVTPEKAKTELKMPTGRYHLDTQLGPTLATYQFLKPIKTHGSIQLEELDDSPKDTWTVGKDGTLTLRRKLHTNGRKTDHRFVLSVDPVFGYRIDAKYDIRFEKHPGPRAKLGAPTFTPGCYPVWPEHRVYDRTVHTPGFGGSGYRGWANNLIVMDRCDVNKKKNSWRDGGFIAHLTTRDGWGVVHTREDGSPDIAMPVCNAHNDFHAAAKVPETLPRDENGWLHWTPHYRLMGLPPEISKHIWDEMKLVCADQKGIVMGVGEIEGFEEEPTPLSEPERGLVWTSGGPKVTTDEARSGTKSIVMDRSQRPNLPQVACKPNSRYRIEAYFKLKPLTDEQIAKRKARRARRIEKLKKKGKKAPEPRDGSKLEPRAYIKARWFEWSPYRNEWIKVLESDKATAETDAWQRVVLEFDTPAYDPFVDLVIEVEDATAYMDDFHFRRIGPAEGNGE